MMAFSAMWIDYDTVLQIIAIITLTLLSALSACSEIAFFSLPSSRIKSYRTHRDPKKRQVARLLKQSTSLLVTIFMFNTIMNVLLQNVTSDLFELSGGWVLKVGLPLFLVLIFGDLVPKYIGLIHNEPVAIASASSLELLQKVIAPGRIVITEVSNFISRIMFFFLKADQPPSGEELQHILQSSKGKGLLHQDEAELIFGVLTLEDKQAKEIMLPRSSMPSYSIKEPLTKLIYLFSEQTLSEICILDEHEETVLGIISARTFFIRRKEIGKGEDLILLLQPPLFIPETTSAKSVLEQLKEQGTSIALVIDEYGSTTGLISERSLFDQIIKTKRAAEEPHEDFHHVSHDAIIASGTLSLAQIKEVFGVTLTSSYHVVTIGGWLAERLNQIPQSGEIWREKELFFRVLSADPTHVRKVYIQHEKRKEAKSTP